MPPLIDTNTSEPSSTVLTPDTSLDGSNAPIPAGLKGSGRGPTRLDLDLQASVRKLEEAQCRRESARQGGDSRRGSGDSDGQATPNSGDKRGSGESGKMAPSPLPVTIHAPTPPRMSRMPSLSQITSHLHIPSPSTPSSTNQNLSPALTTPITSFPIAAGSSPLTAGAGHGFAMSPSGRLRLPASAMTRSRSGSGSGSSTATLKSLGMFRSGSAQSTNSALGNAVGPAGSSAGSDAGSSVSASPLPSPTMLGSDVKSGVGKVDASNQTEAGTWRSKTAGPAASDTKRSSGARASVPAPSGSLEHAKAMEGVAIAEKPAKIDMSQPLRLRYTWSLYYDAKGYKPDLGQSAAKDGGTGLGEYEQSLLHVGTIDTVQSFAQHMTSIRTPSRLPKNANYHLFKSPIRPMWEDPSNAKGGKWVVLFRSCPHLLDWAWANLTMGLIGDVLDEEDQVTGVVGSCRPKMDRIQIWTRGRGLDDGKDGDVSDGGGQGVKDLNDLGRRIWEMMRLEGEVENVSIEFQYNDSHNSPPAGRFFTVPFSGRSFSSSYSAASSTKSISSSTLPTLNLPTNPLLSPSGISSVNSSRSPSRAPSGSYRSTSGSGSAISTSMSPKGATPYLPNTTSPLQQSTRFDNTPTGSPALGSSPSFGGAGAGLMGMSAAKHSLPRPPDIKTIKASYGLSADASSGMAATPSPLVSGKTLMSGLASLPPTPSPAVQAASYQAGTGGMGMKRAGSNQGSQAFAGPMGGGLGLGLRGAGR